MTAPVLIVGIVQTTAPKDRRLAEIRRGAPHDKGLPLGARRVHQAEFSFLVHASENEVRDPELLVDLLLEIGAEEDSGHLGRLQRDVLVAIALEEAKVPAGSVILEPFRPVLPSAGIPFACEAPGCSKQGRFRTQGNPCRKVLWEQTTAKGPFGHWTFTSGSPRGMSLRRLKEEDAHQFLVLLVCERCRRRTFKRCAWEHRDQLMPEWQRCREVVAGADYCSRHRGRGARAALEAYNRQLGQTGVEPKRGARRAFAPVVRQ